MFNVHEAITMARTIDQRKVNKWRRWMREYNDSDMTIQEFASRHNVSVASSYWWFRQLRNGRFGPDPAAQATSVATHQAAEAVAHPQPMPIEPMATPPPQQPVIPASQTIERIVQLPERFEHGFVLVLPGGLRINVDKTTADAVAGMLVGAIRNAQ